MFLITKMKRMLASNLIFLGVGMSFWLTGVASIHSQTSPQLNFNQLGGQILSQSPSCPIDEQTYTPPPTRGYIYAVIKPRTKKQITVKVQWGPFQKQQDIDVSGYEGVVVRLKHLEEDPVPLTITVKCGDIIGLVQQYEEGKSPSQWNDPKYEKRTW